MATRNSIDLKAKNLYRRGISFILSFIKFLPRYVWIALAIIILTIIGFLVFFRTNLFLVSKLEITELNYVDRDKVYDRTKKYLGERFFSVNPDEIENKVLPLSPYIKLVNVEKTLPDKLKINIVERTPILRIQHVPTAKNFLVDEEIIVLETNSSLESIGEPQLSLVQVNFDVYDKLPKKTGSKLNLEGLEFVINAKTRLFENEIELDTLKTIVLNQTSMEFSLKTGTKVMMDPSRDLEDQIDRLEAILEDTKTKDKELVYVDVSLEKPFGKYK